MASSSGDHQQQQYLGGSQWDSSEGGAYYREDGLESPYPDADELFRPGVYRALYAFESKSPQRHFDRRAWAVVTQSGVCDLKGVAVHRA